MAHRPGLVPLVVLLILGALLFGLSGGAEETLLDLTCTFLMGLGTVWSFLAMQEEDEADA